LKKEWETGRLGDIKMGKWGDGENKRNRVGETIKGCVQLLRIFWNTKNLQDKAL
jgi:hypothetical protein